MKTEYEQSAISFAEYKDPLTEDIAAVLLDRPGGRKAIVAYIRQGNDSGDGRTMYSVFDTEGTQIISPSASLSIIKKDIRKREQQFHEQESIKEQALTQDMAEEERKRFKELRTMRSATVKAQSRSR